MIEAQYLEWDELDAITEEQIKVLEDLFNEIEEYPPDDLNELDMTQAKSLETRMRNYIEKRSKHGV